MLRSPTGRLFSPKPLSHGFPLSYLLVHLQRHTTASWPPLSIALLGHVLSLRRFTVPKAELKLTWA